MTDQEKAEMDKVWNGLKAEVEALSARITALYETAGLARTCRHINELWKPEKAVGLGFVPPEVRERLEALLTRQGISLHKGHGPLGKGVYFSMLYNSQLTAEKLRQLTALVEKEIVILKDAPPLPSPKPTLPAELIIEEQVARMEGLIVARPEKPKTRPAEVADLVDAFNRMTEDMPPRQAISLLADAIPHLNLPEITIRELLRTMDMLLAAER